jgi:hypothetical protein
MGHLVDAILADKEKQLKLVWQAREWTIFCAKTIEAQAPDFWKDLLAAVQELVKKLRLPATACQELFPSRFIVHEPHYPTIDVLVELDVAARTIRYTTILKPSRDVLASHSERRLPFHLDEAGELYLKRGDAILNVADAAELLLQPFLKGSHKSIS